MKETVQYLKDTHKFCVGDTWYANFNNPPLKRKIIEIDLEKVTITIERELSRNGKIEKDISIEPRKVIMEMFNEGKYLNYKRVTSVREYPSLPKRFQLEDTFECAAGSLKIVSMNIISTTETIYNIKKTGSLGTFKRTHAEILNKFTTSFYWNYVSFKPIIKSVEYDSAFGKTTTIELKRNISDNEEVLLIGG